MSVGYLVKGELPVPSEWFHLAMVFHEPDVNQRFTVYINNQSFRSTSLLGNKTTSGVHDLIFGALYPDKPEKEELYSSMMADELTFWNRQLDQDDVEALRSMYLSV